MVEHACWKGEILGSNLDRGTNSVHLECGHLSSEMIVMFLFFLLPYFFTPFGFCSGTMEHQKKDPISCPILTTISVAIIPRYRDTRNWYPILTSISGYHVTDIGTPDIVPDINPDIRYVVYDIGDTMTRYRVCTRYRYPISGQIGRASCRERV